MAPARGGERGTEGAGRGGRGRAPHEGGLTQSTSVFIRRSILVLLNFVLPLFCMSLVSGPRRGGEGLGRRLANGAAPRPPGLCWGRGQPTRELRGA